MDAAVSCRLHRRHDDRREAVGCRLPRESAATAAHEVDRRRAQGLAECNGAEQITRRVFVGGLQRFRSGNERVTKARNPRQDRRGEFAGLDMSSAGNQGSRECHVRDAD
jgi:hypothetical protein